MKFYLPDLPFNPTDLLPVLSDQTVYYHHKGHHAAYVNKLNKLIKNTQYENMTLEEIVRVSENELLHNAAQAWNHTLYWNCLTGMRTAINPEGSFAAAINETFGSADKMKKEFLQAAGNVFGSGWTWLVLDGQDRLKIISTSNEGCPIRNNERPILTCDVWEHAYYIDYRHEKTKFLPGFWKLINWEYVESLYNQKKIPELTLQLCKITRAA